MNKKCTKEPLAKPSGITLKVHTDDVIREGDLLLKGLIATQHKYLDISGKQLDRRVELSCRYHDDGKRHPRWQRACNRDYEAFCAWRATHPHSSFKEYQKRNNRAGEHLHKADIRHEFHSIKKFLKSSKPPLRDCLIVAIAAHHRKLSFRHQDRWLREDDREIQEIWKTLRRLSNEFFDKGEDMTRNVAKKVFEFSGPRSLLQLADHRASAKEDGNKIPDPTYFSYSFPSSWAKRPVQQIVEEHWREDLLLVRAPTGAGKTDAALLWASLQIKHNRADRLVIAMPTRFTSNALAVSVSSTLSSTGLYHSSAWQNGVGREVKEGISALDEARFLHNQAYLLQTPVTICTIDHLLNALTLCKEEYHTIVFALANSCLVIDEADFYDKFTEANILVLLELLSYWRVPVLLMSASLPDSALKHYNETGYRVENILEDTSDLTRDRFILKEKRSVLFSTLSDMKDLLELCRERENAILYANTVDRAQAYYQWFLDHAPEMEIVLYHSRFTEPDKMKKEAALLHLLGKEAWQEGKARGIAILTQIGEMSVNISTELMISDIAPIDRLTQRAGRLCRFSKSVGELYVVCPIHNDELFAAPYYHVEKNKLLPNEAILKTDELLSEGTYSAGKLVQLLNKIYAEETLYTLDAKKNAQELKSLFETNWLINPLEDLNEKNSTSKFWQARDIIPQCKVYVKEPPCVFDSYASFRLWESDVVISLPISLREKIMRQDASIFRVVEYGIGRETHKLLVLNKACYSIERGVYFVESLLKGSNYEFL